MSFFRTARDAAAFRTGMDHPILSLIGPTLLRILALIVVAGAALAAWEHRAELPWWGWIVGGGFAVALLRRAGRAGRRDRYDDYDYD